jgi:hypothetical protein
MPPQGQPGWGAPPPQGWAPQGAMPQGQPGWGAPPPKKGGGCGRTLFILLLLLLIGGAAYVLVAKPSWSPLAAKAPATPGLALPTPKSTSPTSSTSPAPLISVEPGGSVGLPTSAPTSAATAGTSPGATAATGDLQTCRADKAGITVSYPAGWYTVTGFPDWNCMLFDRNPIDIKPNTELPAVAIQISQETRDYLTVVEDFKTNTVYELVGSDTGLVDGLDATALEVNNTGAGYFQKGVHQLVVVVDRGSLGCLVLEVIGNPGADFDANSQILGSVVDKIKIDQ